MNEMVEANQQVLDVKTMEALVVGGDMAKLTPEQKIAYYRARCEAAGLDPRTAPFQYMTLQGKTTLYATKGATDQLSKIHKIKLQVVEQKTENDIRTVLVRAEAGDGRATDEMGAVSVGGLKGNDLANAYMKAITKAKRRAILSLCGLGMLDETELETVRGVATEAADIQMPRAVPGPAVSNAEPDPIDAPGDAQEPANDGAFRSIDLVAFQRIIAEKDAKVATGTVYHAYPVDSKVGILSTHDRALAIKIKNAVAEKRLVKVTINGANMIVNVEDATTVA